MPYWGSGPVDNDYAFDAVSAYVFIIKERMFRDAETVAAKSYPEQGIVASVVCLRLLATAFPKCVAVHFRKKDIQAARDAFRSWYNAVGPQLPDDIRESIRSSAEADFNSFETQLLAAGNY